MKSSYTSRWATFCRNFFLLGLGTLVFAWGLQYKVSLDEGPHSVTHHMVEAKLVTADGLSTASKGVAAILPSGLDKLPAAAPLAVTFLLFLTAILWDMSPRSTRLEHADISPSCKLKRVTNGAFFFRPPPSR